MLQIQQIRIPFFVGLAKFFNGRPVICSTNDRTEGDEEYMR